MKPTRVLFVAILVMTSRQGVCDILVRYELLGGTARPGDTVTVPFVMRPDAPVIGFGFSIDFDETVLRFLDVDVLFQRPDGAPYDVWCFNYNNNDAQPGSGGVDEGWLEGCAIFSNYYDVAIPANTDTKVLAFHFRVKSETKASAAELSFMDGAANPLFANAVTLLGEETAHLPTVTNATVFTNALLQLVSSPAFLRGDSNADGKVDISDALAALGFLFSGDDAMPCADAADANDDGRVDVSDPIAALGYLFLGRPRLPEPFDTCGTDSTEDPLDCAAYASCP